MSATLHIAAGIEPHRRPPVARLQQASDTKKRVQNEQRRWLGVIVKATGLSLSQVAAKSGISDTTLTRLANDDSYSGTLSPLTIERIKEGLRVPGPDEFASPRRLVGLLGLAEAERFIRKSEPGALANAVEALIAGRDGIEPWRLKTEALVACGYLPGDLVLVDLNASAEPQDVVCAQLNDWQRGGVETVWRVYDPPFLVAAARDRTAFKPLLVDNDRVIIKGVLVESLRPHRLSATR